MLSEPFVREFIDIEIVYFTVNIQISFIALVLIITLQFSSMTVSASPMNLDWGISAGEDHEFRIITSIDYVRNIPII